MAQLAFTPSLPFQADSTLAKETSRLLAARTGSSTPLSVGVVSIVRKVLELSVRSHQAASRSRLKSRSATAKEVLGHAPHLLLR